MDITTLCNPSVVLNHLWREIKYIIDAEKYLEELDGSMEDLKAKQSDVQREIKRCERNRLRCTSEVNHWLEKAAAKEQEIAKIKEDYGQGGCLPFRSCFFTFPSIVSRRAIKATTEVKNLIDEHASFNTIVVPSSPQTILEKPVPRTVGMAMESNLGKARGYLSDVKVGIVGIWGMGGVGKTTLLNNLNNSMLGNDHLGFNHVIYVVASRDLQLEKLRNEIAKELDLSDCSNDSIFNFLKDKSFLLLLDDLWKELDLSRIGIPHPHHAKSQNSPNQKVVLTTRFEWVCGYMEADMKIKVECLKPKAAWDLFRDKAGGRMIASSLIIESVAREITKKCGGLPLALNIIGRAMSTKRTFEQWEYAFKSLNDSEINIITGQEDPLLSTLKFSYDSLPDETIQECFLCCSLWPEDRIIPKDVLIDCWLGHGLIDKFENFSKVLNYGRYIIGILTEACLLEPETIQVEAGDMHGPEVIHVEGVKMHEVVRDLALWIASDCGTRKKKWMVEAGEFNEVVSKEMAEKWSESERISLVNIKALPEELPHCPKLSTFISRLGACYLKPLTIPQGFFGRISTITYLELSHCNLHSLPPDISCLVSLQYLNLSSTKLRSLPDELGDLQELKYLILRDMPRRFTVPPGLISKFLKLRVLNLYPCGEVGLEELESLKGVLKAVGMKVTSLSSLRRLSDLSILGLSIDALEDSTFSPLQSLSRNMLLNLIWCRIFQTDRLTKLVIDDGRKTSGEESCFPKLEVLTLRDLSNLEEIIWKGVVPSTFPRLRCLTIWGCNKLKNVTWVKQLHCLARLGLCFCDEIEQVIGDEEKDEIETDEDGTTNQHALPSLQFVELRTLPMLRNVCDGMITFPSLKYLTVKSCPRLTKLPFTAETVSNNLRIDGPQEWWEGLVWKDDEIRSLIFPRAILRQISP